MNKKSKKRFVEDNILPALKIVKPNLDKYKKIEKHYENKIFAFSFLAKMFFGVTMFCIGLAICSIILDAERFIINRFILFEFLFLGLQMVSGILQSYYISKKSENYNQAEKEADEYIAKIKERNDEISKRINNK